MTSGHSPGSRRRRACRGGPSCCGRGWGGACRRTSTASRTAWAGRRGAEVVLLLSLVLALNSADNAAIAAHRSPARDVPAHRHCADRPAGHRSSLVGALAAMPFGILTDKTGRVRLLSRQHPASGASRRRRAASRPRSPAAAHAPRAGRRDRHRGARRGLAHRRLLPGRRAGPHLRLHHHRRGGGAGLGIGRPRWCPPCSGWRAAFVVLAVPSFASGLGAVVGVCPSPRGAARAASRPGATEIVAAHEVPHDREAGPAGDSEPVRSDDLVLMQQVQKRGVDAR